MPKNIWDVIIVGAGASGLLCAATAAKRGLHALLLEKDTGPGRKLLISGGGKCNLTNLNVQHDNYLGENNKFCKSALARLRPLAVLKTLDKNEIAWEEREHGQIFCRNSASDVLDLLLRQCAGPKFRMSLEQNVTAARREPDAFVVEAGGQELQSAKLVLACGGPACPQVGGGASGLLLAKRFGHRIVPPAPALAPLIMPQNWPLAGLAGISAPVRLSLAAKDKKAPAFTLPMLFTHKGISGPAGLQISGYWRKGDALKIDFLPDMPLTELIAQAENAKMLLQTLLGRRLPARLAAALIPEDLLRRRLAELSKKDLAKLVKVLHEYEAIPTGTEGFRKAEAGRGGVDCAEVSSAGLESKLVPGLHFCGEILDVCGQLGGYNLHWAWASGFAAGQAL